MIPCTPSLKNKIEELADFIRKSYELDTISKRGLVTPMDYDSSKHNGLEFVQFPQRSLIPLRVFEDNSDNKILGTDFARAIGLSEMNYLIKKLDSISPSTKIEELTYLNLFHGIEQPTNIIVPISMLSNFNQKFRQHMNWDRRSAFIKDYNNNNIPIAWSLYKPIQNIFIIRSDLIRWVQKSSKDIPPFKDQPEYLVPIPRDLESKIQILAGESTERGYIDFVVRTVATVQISENATIKIELRE